MGAALTETELAALGQARLAAASQGSASHMFWQLHPFDARAVIPCAANASASPGWSIDLLGEDAAPSAWMLKADRGAALECACHCGWNESCPGVVSVCAGAHHEPPAPPARAEHRNHKVATDSHTQSEIAARTAGTGRHYAGEADRGELHMHHEQYESSPALPAQQSTAPRRGFFAALFGGAAALATREAPSVPAESSWPEPASGSQYRGALHEPESGALSWPAVEFPPTFDALAIEHYAASWGAPKLPAPDAPLRRPPGAILGSLTTMPRFRHLKSRKPATMEGVMNAEETREHIAKALREEYDRLFEIIKALQAKGEDTAKLQTLAGSVRWALQEAERN